MSTAEFFYDTAARAYLRGRLFLKTLQTGEVLNLLPDPVCGEPLGVLELGGVVGAPQLEAARLFTLSFVVIEHDIAVHRLKLVLVVADHGGDVHILGIFAHARDERLRGELIILVIGIFVRARTAAHDNVFRSNHAQEHLVRRGGAAVVARLEEFDLGQLVVLHEILLALLLQIAREEVVLFAAFKLLRKQHAYRIVILVRAVVLVVIVIEYVHGDRLLFVEVVSALRAVRLVVALQTGVDGRAVSLGIVHRRFKPAVQRGVARRRLRILVGAVEPYYRAYLIAV